ncbi:ankyrin and het domain protein [Colletotrichum karsti]|uniref:Ankyrin and het domain protein n=1 Tax=Colletotrichum karsti TaxID=1095194 RepID=A0A9P6HTE0_9PEZI|nr:ankyrin and het domain protein [Colletotrichum karsti]KAF9870243.1 ankyrin and het domain protein [Colletotrichum karsti]
MKPLSHRSLPDGLTEAQPSIFDLQIFKDGARNIEPTQSKDTSEMAMPEYQYTPLGHAQIRQMILLPGRFDEPIQVQVKKSYFEPPLIVQKYEALSYAWGSQEDPETLTIIDASIPSEKRSLCIGQNLASALRHLRNKTKPRTIWCDAVCINQKDLAERAAQVQRMGDIYRHADRVVVWLGPGDEDAYRSMQIMNQISSHIDCHPFTITPRDEEGRRYLYESTGLALSRSDWEGLHAFLSLPWFTRLWVRQEIILTNDSAIVMVVALLMILALRCYAQMAGSESRMNVV